MLLYKPTGGDSAPELVICSMSDKKNKKQTNNQNNPLFFQMLLEVCHWPSNIFLEHKSAKLQSLLSWDMRMNWTQRVFSSSFKLINLVTEYSSSFKKNDISRLNSKINHPLKSHVNTVWDFGAILASKAENIAMFSCDTLSSK